jgi:hypothetical protein
LSKRIVRLPCGRPDQGEDQLASSGSRSVTKLKGRETAYATILVFIEGTERGSYIVSCSLRHAALQAGDCNANINLAQVVTGSIHAAQHGKKSRRKPGLYGLDQLTFGFGNPHCAARLRLVMSQIGVVSAADEQGDDEGAYYDLGL